MKGNAHSAPVDFIDEIMNISTINEDGRLVPGFINASILIFTSIETCQMLRKDFLQGQSRL